MCGLVGIAGALGRDDENVMKRMLMLDMERGEDSTGLAAIRNDGEVKIAKVADHPLTLFEMESFKQALNGYNSIAFLGHNRKSTRGRTIKANAHPFEAGHIVGAHNGTLWPGSFKELCTKLGQEFEVDSEAIIASIAEFGIEETVKMLDGSYALTYVNLMNGTINFIRNKERPLWWAASKDSKFIYWASEWPTIRGGVTCHPIKGEYRDLYYNDKGHCMFGFDEDVHYSFDLDVLRKGKWDGLPKPKVKKMEGKERFLGTSSNCGIHTGGSTRAPWKQRGKQDDNKDNTTRTQSGNKATLSTTTSLRGISNPPSSVLLDVAGSKEYPTGGYISRREFEEMSGDGCSLCHTPIRWGDTGIAIYKDDGIILCPAHAPPGVTDGQIRIYLPAIPQVA